jgi:F-type H+-transporting ATPase subunit a
MNVMTFIIAAGAQPDPKSHVLPHYLFGSSWFTNHHLMTLVAAIGGFLLIWLVANKIQVVNPKSNDDLQTKGRVPQLFETICVFLRDSVTRPMLGELTDKYIYYIWSIFFFILFCNLLGMIPIGPLFGVIGGVKYSHFGGTATGNLNFTAGLAIVAFIMIHAIGIKEHGLAYFKHFCPVPLKLDYLLPLMIVIAVLMVIVEIIGALVKPFALAVRLFANMVAGHLVLGSLIIMAISAGYVGKGATILGATVFSFLELFVAFLQAYIFTFLTVIFISLGAAHHDDHHDEHDDGVGDVLNEEAAIAAH